jgi:hypothetical protein
LGPHLRPVTSAWPNIYWKIGPALMGYHVLISFRSGSLCFGRILHFGALETLDCLLSLVKKFNQEPNFLVSPDLQETALHCASGQLFLHDKSQCSKLYSILLDIFPGEIHLEARNFKGWTPPHCAHRIAQRRRCWSSH